jgi:hypothetical protein
MLPYSREGIATAHIASNVLRGVAVEDFTPEHGMREAPDFMLDSKQFSVCLGMHDIDEAILIGATLLRDQAMFF